MGDNKITKVWGRQILDSRGNPTVEVDIHTKHGMTRGAAPSGASTGTHESLELRDGKAPFLGKGVETAVANIRGPVAKLLVGMDVTDQEGLDRSLIEIDGTPNKSNLGGNVLTATSIACAHAGAMAKRIELFQHLGPGSRVLPVPMLNIINGGKHAGSELAIQEFMIVPAGAKTFSQAVRMGAEVYHHLKSTLKERYGKSAVNVGDEGGFAPPLKTASEALEIITTAIETADYAPGKDVFLALDAAASEFFSDERYRLDGRAFDLRDIVDYYEELIDSFPLLSLEDPVDEEDFETMSVMTERMGDKVQLVGDDIFVTNPSRVRKGVSMGAGNALLLKVNQIGTITEAFEAAKIAFDARFNVVVSHRSGETEDTTLADIVVALQSGQVKTGAPARGERTSKYNRLLRIEESLGSKAIFPGREAFTQRPYCP